MDPHWSYLVWKIIEKLDIELIRERYSAHRFLLTLLHFHVLGHHLIFFGWLWRYFRIYWLWIYFSDDRRNGWNRLLRLDDWHIPESYPRLQREELKWRAIGTDWPVVDSTWQSQKIGDPIQIHLQRSPGLLLSAIQIRCKHRIRQIIWRQQFILWTAETKAAKECSGRHFPKLHNHIQ